MSVRLHPLVTGDDILRGYLTGNPEESDRALARLCSEVLLPRCRLVVRARLWRHREDVEDVTHDVVMRLVRRLQTMRADGDTQSVRCVTDWAAGAATRACSAFLRKEHPLRTHLANALRYRFGRSVVFRMWRGSNTRLVCGWRKCRSVPPLTGLAFQNVVELPRVAARLAHIDPENSLTFWKPLTAIFASANGPVYFNALVTEFSIRSFSANGTSLPIADVAETPSRERADEAAIRKELLGRLWQAVMELPRDERLALLLNLRGTEGLAAWWDHEVAPPAAVAAAVGVSLEQLGDLPISDFEIADRLELDDADPVRRRQRVINLRRSARRRLAGRFDP